MKFCTGEYLDRRDPDYGFLTRVHLEFEISFSDPHRRKYQDAVTEVLSYWHGAGMVTPDEERGNPDLGEGRARFGRWVLGWESSGYVWSERYADPRAAAQGIAGLYADPEECPDQVLATWLWQALASGPDGECESADDHTETDDIPDEVKAEIAEGWLTFIAYAQPLIDDHDQAYGDAIGHSLWAADPEQVEHDWVLTSYGHGTGFWDRYSVGYGPAEPYGSLGRQLSELAKLYPCPSVGFTSPDGWEVNS